MNTLTSDEIMDRAADIIDERGWITGTFMNESTGQVCTWGALWVSVDPTIRPGTVDAQQPPELQPVIEFIQRPCYFGGLGDSITWWNDYDCTSGAQAADMLRRQAKNWREKHS